MSRLITLLIIIVGISLIIIQLFKEQVNGNSEKIIYRYIPRSFNEQYDNPVPVSEIFTKMFSNPSPWMSGLNTYDEKGSAEINKFFVSQS